jgi:hypothetical protein
MNLLITSPFLPSPPSHFKATNDLLSFIIGLLLEPFLQPFCSGYFGNGVSLFAQASLDQ